MICVQQGDEEAFNEIYARYSSRILHFLFRMLGQDEALAQDFLQDVFLKIVTAPEKFDPTRNFKTWIFTVAANLCKNSFRNKKYLPSSLPHANEVIAESNVGDLDDETFKADFLIALDQLLPVYKEVFVLRYEDDLSLNEIAVVADCPLGTVKSRLHSATRILSEKLIQYQFHLYEH